MDFFAHAFTERRIDELMTLNQALTFKGRRHDERRKMLAIPFDFEMGAIEARGDVVFDEFGCGQHGSAFSMISKLMAQLIAGFKHPQRQRDQYDEKGSHDRKADGRMHIRMAKEAIAEPIYHIKKRVEMGNCLPNRW